MKIQRCETQRICLKSLRNSKAIDARLTDNPCHDIAPSPDVLSLTPSTLYLSPYLFLKLSNPTLHIGQFTPRHNCC